MSITTLQKQIEHLRRNVERRTHDKIDRVLSIVEIHVDEFHSRGHPTIEQLETWFVENCTLTVEEIRLNRQYIQEALNALAIPPGVTSAPGG